MFKWIENLWNVYPSVKNILLTYCRTFIVESRQLLVQTVRKNQYIDIYLTGD